MKRINDLTNNIEIGLFCGTFNPIHNAHLLLAQCALDQFGLAKVYFVTSPRPPHRQDVILSGEERHDMVSEAVLDNDKFIASTLEVERAGPSYTVDTIKHLKTQFNVNLLVGADNVIHLSTWHKFDEISQLCRLLIAPRCLEAKGRLARMEILTASELAILAKTQYDLIDSPLIDISSSSIRQRVKAGKSVRYMVPEPVWKTIEKEQYYK